MLSVWDLCGNDLRASLRIGAPNAYVEDTVIRRPSAVRSRASQGAFGVDAFASDSELGFGSGGYSGGSPRGDGSARSPHHVCGMASSNNGQYMLTAGTDSAIRLWDMFTPGASCVVGRPQYRPNVSDGFSVEERGLRCLSWTDVEEQAPQGGGGAGASGGGPSTAATQCHLDAITALEVRARVMSYLRTLP